MNEVEPVEGGDRPPLEYRPVAGFPDYRVGNDGSVWSMRTKNRWKQLRPHERGEKRYLYINMKSPGRPSKTTGCRVHRLVLEAFVGPCPEGMEALHGNGSRSDNRLANLRWGTHQENMEDAVNHGTLKCGSDNPSSKLGESDIPAIRGLASQGIPRRTIAARYGVSHGAINQIVNGKKWRRVV